MSNWEIEKLESFMCGVDKKNIFFYTFPDADLVAVDRKNGTVKFLERIIESTFDDISNYIICIDGQIARVGNKADKLTLYDLEEMVETTINLDQLEKKCAGSSVVNIYGFRNRIYIFLRHWNYVYIYNLKTGNLEKQTYCSNDEIQYQESLYKDSCLIGDTIWLYGGRENKIASYDLENGLYHVFNLPHEISTCKCITGWQEKIYILTIDNKIFCFDINMQKCILVWENKDQKLDFDKIHVVNQCNDQFILLPSIECEDIYYLCQGHLEKYTDYPNEFEYIWPHQYKYARYGEDEKYYIYPLRASNAILFIEKGTGRISWMMPDISDIEMFEQMKKRSRIIHETKYTSMEKYINLLKESKDI